MTLPVDENGHDVLSPSEASDFCRRYVAAWNTRDPGNVVELVASDVIWRDDAIGQPATSREGVRSYIQTLLDAMPDLEIIPISEPMLSLDGARVAVHYVGTGTQTGPLTPPGLAPSNQRMEFDGVTMIRLKGGLIHRYRTVYNLATVSVQLGALPRPGSLVERIGILLQRVLAIVLRRRKADAPQLPSTFESELR
jgi:steroid delta-isomerase-like uncharacterized protein